MRRLRLGTRRGGGGGLGGGGEKRKQDTGDGEGNKEIGASEKWQAVGAIEGGWIVEGMKKMMRQTELWCEV